MSCVSGFLQHLIFIKDQACWLTHGAIFPFVPFFLLTFDWVVSNERRTVCAGKCHSSPGGTPLYKPYRYVPPQRVGFLRRFGLKTGIDFPHFGPESKIGYGFPGNFESVRKYLLFQFQMSSEEREICQFEMAFKKSFLLLF